MDEFGHLVAVSSLVKAPPTSSADLTSTVSVCVAPMSRSVAMTAIMLLRVTHTAGFAFTGFARAAAANPPTRVGGAGKGVRMMSTREELAAVANAQRKVPDATAGCAIAQKWCVTYREREERRQPPATSHQPTADSRQPPADSRQPTADSRQ